MTVMLLGLYRDSPQLCYDGQKLWQRSENLLSELLLKLIMPDGFPMVELERRLMHGREYDVAYENTLKVLLEYGANPTDGFMNSCPLMGALRRDDLAAVKLFVEALENKGVDALFHLKDPGNLRNDPNAARSDITAPAICAMFNSIHSFEYLLQKFPILASDVAQDDSGTTILHKVCANKGGTPFVEVLLRCGADVTSRNKHGQTPISRALLEGHLGTANAISNHCSAEELKELLRRDSDTGLSIFFYLLIAWPYQRSLELVDSFQWLAKHNGTHLHGPSGMPAWYQIVQSPRPFSNAHRRLDIELLTLLLSIDNLGNRLSTERWEGKTILHHSVWSGHVEVVKLLLDRKFDPNIGMDYFGEIPEELPTHIFDPKKDSVTALDMVSLRLSGLDIPPEIVHGGYLETQKWTEDLEHIRRLLVERGGQSIVFDSIKKVVGADSREAGIISNMLLKGGEMMVGSWPKPVIDRPRPKPPLPKTRHEILADTQTRDEAFYNVMRSELQQKEMTKRREVEKKSAPDLQKIKAIANLKKHQWRLPPSWRCLSLTEDKNEPSGYTALYMNGETGEYTYERPKLYRGEQEVESDKEKGKAIQDDIYNATPVMKPEATSNEPDIASLSLNELNSLPSSKPPSMKHLAGELPSSNIQHKSNPNQKMPSSVPDSSLITITSKGGIMQIPSDYTRLKYEDGSTMLHFAAQFGELEFLSILLEQNSIPVDVERNDGCTPLHAAVDAEELDAVALLLTSGADPNRIFPRRGHRPIHHSAFQSSADMANVLVQGGADVNATTVEGYSPLHFCVAAGDNPEILEVILDAGADANVVGPEGSVLRMAVKNGREASVDMLLGAGAHIDEDENLLHVAAEGQSLKIAQALLDQGLDVNKRDDGSQTPVITAIVYQRFEMLRLLAERGGDISVVEEFQFFLRPRDDGKIDRMGMHVGRGNHVSAEALNAEFGTDDGIWEDWQPVKVRKIQDAEDNSGDRQV
ncbi:ankyrin repeat-containing domain protein [Xylariaceae sp. FL1651]|nr:ankyrin repeat-containing domain protein [Xylariaceae sp. FL1651]